MTTELVMEGGGGNGQRNGSQKATGVGPLSMLETESWRKVFQAERASLPPFPFRFSRNPCPPLTAVMTQPGPSVKV